MVVFCFTLITAFLPSAAKPEIRIAAARSSLAATTKKKTTKPPATPAPVRIRTDSEQAELRIKKARGKAVLVQPHESIDAEVAGPGTLVVTMYQVLKPDTAKATDEVVLKVWVDGQPNIDMKQKGVRLADATAQTVRTSWALSKPISASFTVTSTTHTLTLSHAAGGNCVVTLEYTPTGATQMATLLFAPAEKKADTGTPSAATVPIETRPIPPPPTAASVSEIERRIEAGEIRDALLGTYSTVRIRSSNVVEETLYYKVVPEKPFVFVVDGPGVATLRAYWIANPGTKTMPVKLTVLENDVLLQALELNVEPSFTRTIDGDSGLLVSDPKEYKLTLGPKRSRFVIQPSEGTGSTVAIAYAFEAKPKSKAMALTMDLGDDLGVGEGDLAGQTMFTEVAVRERVVEVQKLVQMAAAPESLGLALLGGVIAPTWRGVPAYTAGVEARIGLPFADHHFAISIQAFGAKQDLTSSAADPQGAHVDASAGVLAFPLIASLVTRLPFNKWLALYANLGGGVTYVRASQTGDAALVVARWLPTGSAALGLEAELGPGWLAIDGGYLFVPSASYGNVLHDYTPGGIPVSLRYRIGL